MRFGIGVGFGTLLLVAMATVVLAPLVLGVLIAAALVLAAAAAIGAVTGHRVRIPAEALATVGWALVAAIPLGLGVAFFGHADQTAVEVGLYTALAALPTSLVLLAASIFAAD
jgi:hypothetical protein